MKRFLLFILSAIATGALHAQLEEPFNIDPEPRGWILASGAQWKSAEGIVLSPGAGGNDPSMIGTPAVDKTSATVKVCIDISAQNTNGDPISFPCSPTYMDVLFVNSSVNTTKKSVVEANTYARVDNYVLSNSGTHCVTFTFPANVLAADFKVFLAFHDPCGTGGYRLVIDNISISGVDEVCGSGGNCAPTALDDVFFRGDNTELSFNAVLYGSNEQYPPAGSNVAVDVTGTDNDQNDAYESLQWSVVSPPDPVLGSVQFNAGGAVTITRTSTAVTQLTFTYQLCDPGGLCDQATVTVNWAPAGTLPVLLLNYNAARSGSYVTLQWTTSMESNNTGFEIQRTNANGKYEKVGFVATKASDGNSNSSLQYQFKELNTSTGLTWYRLVQIDKDGASTIYGAKGVRGMEESARVSIYPNPGTSGNMNVLFGSNAPRDIMIADLSGKVIKSYVSYQDGNLVISGLTPGIYTLMITNKTTQEKQAHKMVIIK
jgi:hypothetical protein